MGFGSPLFLLGLSDGRAFNPGIDAMLIVPGENHVLVVLPAAFTDDERP